MRPLRLASNVAGAGASFRETRLTKVHTEPQALLLEDTASSLTFSCHSWHNWDQEQALITRTRRMLKCQELVCG